VWSQVQEAARSKPSMTSWVNALELVSLDASGVTVRLQTGHAQVRGFLTPTRLAQLGELMRPIIGRSPHVKLDAPRGPEADSPPRGGPRRTSVDIDAAMQLPLVRELVDESKGDASIVGLEDDPDAPGSGSLTNDQASDDDDASAGQKPTA